MLKSRRAKAAIVLCSVFGATQLASAANYYVDPNYTGVNGAPFGNYAAAYSNIASALGAIPGVTGVPSGASPSSPNYLYFANGTYNTTTGMATPASLSYSKANVDFVGLSQNPNNVIITSTLDSLYNPGSGAYGTTGSASLQLKGNNQSAAYVTFANSTDTPYIDNTVQLAESPTGTFPTLNGAGASNAQTANQPAVALLLQGDEQVFNDVKVLGYQDSLYTKGGRSIFNNSLVSGDVDFIFANGTTVFNNTTINIDSDHSGGDIVAPSTAKTTSNGLVFLNSPITGNSMAGNPVIDPNNGGNPSPTAANSMYLGRPWNTQAGGDAGAVFINSPIASVGGTSIIKSAGWLAWNSTETATTNTSNGGGNPAEDGRLAEYNSTDLTSGQPISITGRVPWSHQLTASQAADYTVDNIFSESYPWYGDGYPSTDTDTIGNTGLSAAGTGSANPTDPNFSWPAYWGDRNVNDQGNAEAATLMNDPGSYSDSNWTLGGNWDPTNQLALSIVEVPEPATVTILGGVLVAPLLRRPGRRKNAR